jgi:MoxR-like ATPase
MANSPSYTYTYTGKVLPPPKSLSASTGQPLYPYLPSADLVEAVNLAIALQRPLLLEGDPGCGKTCLAEALVYELSQINNTPMPFYPWYVKSASRGREGLYTYDALGRLRDAQMLGGNLTQLEQFLNPDDLAQVKERLMKPDKYIEFGPLGHAIREPEKRAVVLIDEVDKADSDFANDLLLELDRYQFTLPEINDAQGYSAPPDRAPIIILTSNRERPLPAPFLRRCLYFYVEFPQDDRLREIVTQRFVKIPPGREALVTAMIQHIEQIRTALQDQPGSRPPGTSEFLDCLTALWAKPKAEAVKDLANLGERLPLLGLLLKTEADQALYKRKLGQAKGNG